MGNGRGLLEKVKTRSLHPRKPLAGKGLAALVSLCGGNQRSDIQLRTRARPAGVSGNAEGAAAGDEAFEPI